MKTVAVLGASSDRNKFGNKAVRAFRQQGYEVYPVNPGEPEVEGLQAYPSVKDLPVRPDIVTAYVPPPRLVRILPEVAAKGCDALWLNPGTDTQEVVAAAKSLNLHVVCHCSIIAIGVSPASL